MALTESGRARVGKRLTRGASGLDLFSVPGAPIDIQLRGESDQYATIIGDAADFRSDSLQVRMCR